MAYIQITTRCNMTCAHCCFSATSNGQDMDHEMFFKALTLASSVSGIVTIGGWEPTIHKHFFDFVDLAVQWYIKGKFELPPLVITNGKLPGKADKLLDMVASGAPLCVELSQDEFHDPVKDRIVERFKMMERAFDRCPSGEGVRWHQDGNQYRGVGPRRRTCPGHLHQEHGAMLLRYPVPVSGRQRVSLWVQDPPIGTLDSAPEEFESWGPENSHGYVNEVVWD